MVEFKQTGKGQPAQRLLIGGHRGHISNQRENTIANFEEVLQQDIDYIEIDVQLTKDHQAIIFHDDDLSFSTPLHGAILEYTVTELKSAFEINTLDEVLAWCKRKEMFVMIEVKSKHLSNELLRNTLSEAIIHAIQKNDVSASCIVFGIDYEILAQIKSRMPGLNIGLIVPSEPSDPLELIKDMNAMLYLSYLDDLTPSLVEKLHSFGIVVDGSIVDTKEQLIKALDMKVDMIESNYPEEIRSLYQQLRKE